MARLWATNGTCRFVIFVAASLLVTGCVAAGKGVHPDEAQRLRRIAVVAVEPPPLSVAPYMLGDVLPVVHPAAVPYAFPNPATGSPRPGGFAVGGIFLLAYAAAADAQLRQGPLPYDAYLNREDSWLPSYVFADAAVRRLRSASRMEAVREPGLMRLPGVTFRGRTILMENWLGPIRDWYAAERSPFDHTRHRERYDAVLEVGILNYEIAPGDLLLIQVLIKLVDPKTGKVLGRARAAAYPRVESIKVLLANEGATFKAHVNRLADQLVSEAVRSLGLAAN